MKYILKYPSPKAFEEYLKKYMRCEAKPLGIYKWFTKNIYLEIRDEENEKKPV